MAHSAHGTAHELRQAITKAERERKEQKVNERRSKPSEFDERALSENIIKRNLSKSSHRKLTEDLRIKKVYSTLSLSADILWDSRN